MKRTAVSGGHGWAQQPPDQKEKKKASGLLGWVKRHKILTAAVMFVIVALIVILPSVLATRGSSNHHRPGPTYPNGGSSRNTTIQNDGVLETWWHSTGEINYKTPVQDGNVRQSHAYEVTVSTDGRRYFDSFVYETIPRNGQGNILVPGDLSSKTDEIDSVTIEQDLNVTMAWSSFHYGRDVTVKVHRLDGISANASEVTIRPTTLKYEVQQAGDDVTIQVPYDANGARFSIEFKDNLYSYHLNTTAPIADFVQNQDPNGYGYVESYTSDMLVTSVEPHDALLIFANPFPASDLVPNTRGAYKVPTGHVAGLDKISENTVIFEPGVYWLSGTALANLSSSVNWVYFAPGSYVKGAIWFNSKSSIIKATGLGVLSGEQYVYQANTQDQYRNNKSDEHCVRMWSGNVTQAATRFILSGPTMNAPPFNSMDFRGNVDNLSVQASHYKQVGAFFGQTDGLQAYPGSLMKNIFYHSNDDTIKTYYSNVSVSNVVVWKGRTAPTIQFGWASRSMSNVTVNNIDIIHSKYNQNNTNPAIIGANQVYGSDSSQTDTANLQNTVSGITFSNIRSEGKSPNLMRVVPLANYKGINITNVWVEELLPSATGMDISQLPMWYDGNGDQVSIQDFNVDDFQVGTTGISLGRNNWKTDQTGSLNIDTRFVHSENITIT